MKTCVFCLAFTILVVTGAFASSALKGSSNLHSDKSCVSNDHTGCSCKMADGSGIVDLTSVGYTNNEPRFKDYKGPDGALFSYNPCHSFTAGNCTDAAVCMNSTMTIGKADYASLSYNDEWKTVVAVYSSKEKIVYAAVVKLICDQHTCEPVFDPIGAVIDNSAYYLFKMTSVCACPGMCTSSGARNCKSSYGLLSVGTFVCIGILAIVSSYLLCGIMFQWLRHKGPNVTQCKDMIPHYEVWSSLPGLIKDGVFFTFGCCLPRVYNYQPAPT